MNELPTAPVLVTGASGFIGQHLVQRLVAAGIPARALVLPGEPACPLFPELQDQVEVVRGDITDAAAVAEAMRGCATVYHLAAVVGDWGGAALHEKVTVGGTSVLLRCASRQETRVVLASSIVVYGDRLGLDVCDEDHPHGRAQGPYSRAKQAQERLALQAARDDGLKLSIVRPANVYGPGSQPWVHGVIAELRRGLPALVGGGDFTAGLVCVDHVVEILLRSAAPEAAGRIYNACDEDGITWLQYFRDLARIAGAPPPRPLPRALARVLASAGEGIYSTLHLASRPPLTRESLNLVGSRHRVPVTRAQDELGFRPFVEYPQMIERIGRYVERCLPA